MYSCLGLIQGCLTTGVINSLSLKGANKCPDYHLSDHQNDIDLSDAPEKPVLANLNQYASAGSFGEQCSSCRNRENSVKLFMA